MATPLATPPPPPLISTWQLSRRRDTNLSPPPHPTNYRSSSHPRPIRSAAHFRPYIDIHKGKVGATAAPVTDKLQAEFANLYRQDGLAGGRVIMLDGDASSPSAAFEALRPFPDGMQVEGGVNADELS